MSEEDFYKGLLSALAVVKTHDSQTIFDDIVNTVDEEDLIKYAEKDRKRLRSLHMDYRR